MSNFDPTFFVVKNRALGDSIMGLSAISYLRSLYPKSTIIYAIPQWTVDLYRDVETDADFIYPLKLNSISDIIDLYTYMINLKVTAIHELHQSGRGAKVFSLYSFLKRIPYTFHNHHLKNGESRIIDQGIKKALIQRDLDGLYTFYRKKCNVPSYLNFSPTLKIKLSNSKLNQIIFGVVATRETKMWPLEYFVNLAKEIFLKDSECTIVVPLSKSKTDQKIKNELNNLINDSRFKIIEVPLHELPKIFSTSKLYIGNDTGLKHLAVATNLKTITIFGPEPTKEWHPYNLNQHKVLFIENLKCRTRSQHYCGLYQCDLVGNEFMQCMRGQVVEDVLKLM
jgi:heptosyltransferase-2